MQWIAHENDFSKTRSRNTGGLRSPAPDVVRWGYNAEALFTPFHLSSEQLAEPNFRIPTPVANELVKHALRLTGEP